MRPLFALPVLIALATPASADLRDYQKCIDMAQISPEEVRREAIAWYTETGEPGALHCEAVASIGNGCAQHCCEQTAGNSAIAGCG